jgi:hypothetical protein
MLKSLFSAKAFAGVLVLLLAILLTACGDPATIPTLTLVPAPTVAATVSPARPTNTLQAARASGVATTASATAAVADGPSLTATFPEKTVIRTFKDAEGRTIRLVYGRGTGHNGDYGWAHIYGKHTQGIWYDGGTITTFPKTVGAKSPEQVVDFIGKSLQDKNPDNAGNGRRSYVYAVPNTSWDIFTVVGSDGTIITSYPVRHGTKDEDS